MPSQITFGDQTNQAPLQELQNNKYQFDSFSYPDDLFTNPALNHYVCFYINETKITSFKSVSQTDTQDFTQWATENAPIVNGDGTVTAPTPSQGTIKEQSGNQVANNTQSIKRTNTAIALYMPNLVTKDEHSWSQSALGAASGLTQFAAAAADRNATWDDTVAAVKNAAKDMPSDIFSAMGRRLLQAADAITGENILDAIGQGAREAYNAHLEVLYQGPTFRTFGFSFKMAPRTVKEAQLIANIIRAFRFYSAPELNPNTNGTGRYFIYPAEFDIKFYSNGKPNTFLNRISTCALTNIEVDYTGGNGWTAFRPDDSSNLNTNGVPSQVTLNLQFMEVEIMTKKRILEGF